MRSRRDANVRATLADAMPEPAAAQITMHRESDARPTLNLGLC